MATGAVKWFNRVKGFGFIAPDIGPRDVFVHISAVHRSGLEALNEGDRVEFELTQLHDGRLTAMGLRLIAADIGGGDEEIPPAA
jgi:CspA family cold shock protein